MEGTARIWFTPQQRAELWERWNGQCVADIAAARLDVKNGTIPDPKCDILFVPDVVLGVSEAMRRREFIVLVDREDACGLCRRSGAPAPSKQ
jgi:hypothetical protein